MQPSADVLRRVRARPVSGALPALAALLAFALLARPSAAQTVRGVVVADDSGEPVPGAMVWLVRAADGRETGAASLTDASGRFTLTAPEPGVYRLRAERVGFATTETDPFELAAGAVVERRLAASTQAIELEGIVARAAPRCALGLEVGRETRRVWDEARKVLSAVAWGEQRPDYGFDVARYERELDATTLAVVSERRQSRSVRSRNPVVSLPAEVLADSGYIREHDDGYLFYAPDAHVLLSDPFLETHCFRLRPGGDERPGLIGLGFEPVGGRERPDVAGVLWLDAETAALRSLEFRYTRLPYDVDDRRVGGRLEFDRVPGGPWYVREWHIRAPILGIDAGAGRIGGVGGRRQTVVIGLAETAGEVLEAVDAEGDRIARSEGGAVAGVVVDDSTGLPVVGARVFLSGTSYEAVTDSAGRYRITGVPEGRFRVAVDDRRLDSLAVHPTPREVEVAAGGEAAVRIELPLERARAAWDEAWTPTVVARQPPDRIPAPRQVIRGRLLEAETERGIEDAVVIVEQLDDDSVFVVDTLESDGRGGFVANVRWPGDYRLRVEADGYASAVSEWFRIQAGGAIEAEIRMRPRAIRIEGVTVSVEARRLRLERMGFYDRARSTTGTFITVDDIERRNPRVASDMLRNLPSVRVADGPHGRGAVYMRSGERPGGGQNALEICWPRILLDGYVAFPGGELGPGDAPPLIDDLVAPTDVEGIEVYRDAAELPAQYGGANSACGVIVIWTRAGGGG